MSTFSPLRLNDDVRDETFSCGSLVSRLRISSEMPSLKYSFSASPLMLTNGSTAMVRRSSNGADVVGVACTSGRSEEHTSELQSLMRISYAVFCLTKKKHNTNCICIHHNR